MVYSRTTCASCNAPLDTSEQLFNIENTDVYCTQNRDVHHLPVSCGKCNRKFPNLKELRAHANQCQDDDYHYPFSCAVPGCTLDVKPYLINSHFLEHHPHIEFICVQCNVGFADQEALDRHGKEKMHAAYKCRYPECGSDATRMADLYRHQLKHKKVVRRYPCPHCRK